MNFNIIFNLEFEEDDFDWLDNVIFNAISDEVGFRLTAGDQPLLPHSPKIPLELYEKALQHALWTINVKKQNGEEVY